MTTKDATSEKNAAKSLKMKLIQSVRTPVDLACTRSLCFENFHEIISYAKAHLMLSYYQHLCSTVCCVGNFDIVSFIQAIINQKFGFYAVSAMYLNCSQETFFFCSQSFNKFSCLLRIELT